MWKNNVNDLNDPRIRIYAAPIRNQTTDEATTAIYTDHNGLKYQGVVNGRPDLSIGLPQASTMGHLVMGEYKFTTNCCNTQIVS